MLRFPIALLLDFGVHVMTLNRSSAPPRSVLHLLVSLSLAGSVLVGCGEAGGPDATQTVESPKVEVLVPGSHFHGIHGITARADGQLFAGSVVGARTYQIDPETGAVSTYLDAPTGMADDLEFSPDGSMLAWTSFLLGKVHVRTEPSEQTPAGEILEIADMPGANSIAWRADGRLFFTQVFAGDALWEVDPTGQDPPRRVAENLGGLNGFDFGPDGRLYGPIWFDHRVVSVDVDTGEVQTVTDGFATPAAVNFDSQGNLWVVDTERGEVIRLGQVSANGAPERTVVARVDPSIDNLAFTADDRLFITNMARNAVYEIDTTSGAARAIVEGTLSMPGGLAISSDGGTLFLADTFAYRTIDTSNGEVTDVRLMHGQSLDELDYPISVSTDGRHVLLTSWSSGTVQRVEAATGESVEMLHGFQAPVAAVELEDGRLLVAEAATSRLVEVAADAGRTRSTWFEGLALPAHLALGIDGALYCSEAAAGSISRFDLETGERTVVADGLEMPEGFAQLADGSWLVAEVGTKSLVRLATDGTRETVATELPIGLAAFEGMLPTYIPTGVAAGDGVAYMTSDLDNSILRIRIE